VSLGAPPDHLSPAGQDWNLTGFAPAKLAADDYRAFRRVLGQNLARCGVLRIDHVLGLMRSFWIPDNGAPGGYIRQPLETLLALVRIEAQRAGALVVGEDLGLVPDGLREALHASGIYSYSVLQFEKDQRGDFRHPSQLQHQTLACFGTHDTPTLAGYAKGRDIDLWQRLGWTDAAAAEHARAQRRKDCARLMTLEDEAPPAADAPCDPDTLSQRVHVALARSPAALVSVSLDDMLGEEQAQNLPGTIDEYPNWRRRHRVAVQDLTRDPCFQRLARRMARARPRN
jgi:4-alpha-glucanotransferase